MPLLLFWGVGMGVARLVFRRQMPPVLLGVCSGETNLLPSESRVHYVRLEHPDEIRLAEIDALLFDSRYALTPEWRKLILQAQTAGTPILTLAELNEELYGRVALEDLHITGLKTVESHDTYAVVKQVLDVMAVFLSLPILLPISLIVALLVAFDTGRPILFLQWRIGERGKPFRIVKFRTMKRDSESNGAAFASVGDLRVTQLGYLLRKYRLDEIPQFLNVLRGEMSIIGPRPEQKAFVEEFERKIDFYAVRHLVKPGITGWAQVMQGYAAGADETLEKLRYDIFYIRNFSFWLDARIVAKTVWTILTGFGAR
ncbi:sugar transferase [Deinococcus detaillensis]|nr:sugar transferase [Deinococcus detaillensis]